MYPEFEFMHARGRAVGDKYTGRVIAFMMAVFCQTETSQRDSVQSLARATMRRESHAVSRDPSSLMQDRVSSPNTKVAHYCHNYGA